MEVFQHSPAQYSAAHTMDWHGERTQAAADDDGLEVRRKPDAFVKSVCILTPGVAFAHLVHFTEELMLRPCIGAASCDGPWLPVPM